MISAKHAPLLLGLLLSFPTAGCGAGGLAAVRGQASTEMQCPDLAVTPARTVTGSPTDSGIYYAEGCQKLRRYSVGCNIFGYCPVLQAVDVRDLVQKQAAFDLRCEAAAVKVQRLNTDTFGATGCERQASYVLLCGGSDCRVVQNTQAQ